MSNNPAQIHRQFTSQSSLPPVPSHICDRIIRGEYIEFSTFLPKAMFSSNLEPKSHKFVTVQLASGSDDLSICPATNPQKITFFLS